MPFVLESFLVEDPLFQAIEPMSLSSGWFRTRTWAVDRENRRYVLECSDDRDFLDATRWFTYVSGCRSFKIYREQRQLPDALYYCWSAKEFESNFDAELLSREMESALEALNPFGGHRPFKVKPYL